MVCFNGISVMTFRSFSLKVSLKIYILRLDFTVLSYDYGAEEKRFDSSGEYEIL